MNFDWKKLVGTVAPAIGTALGGPLAGLALKAVATSFGLDESSSEEQVSAAIAGATPADLLKLKQADQQFYKDMKALDVDLERIAMEDRNSARQREIAVKDNTNRNLAYAYTIGYFGLLGAILHWGVNKEVETLVNVLLGILTAAQASIMGYYFGSSKGSDEKTKIIANQGA